jgi:hypothetical protein
MCRVYLIILWFGLFVFENSSANGSVCKNDRTRTVQSEIFYNIENCGNTEIDLGDQNATTSLTHIRAANNQISRISDDTFKSSTELTVIVLSENKIEQISVGAFKDQGKLQYLYLRQNKLTRIEVGTFDSLTELKELWLQNNQLSLIEKGLFNKNKKLKDLFMDTNKIIAIESTVFQNLNQQVYIHLVGNLCSNKNLRGNQFHQNFACFKSYEFLEPHLDQIRQLESQKETSFYILIGVVIVELVIIVILLWRCKSKNEKTEPINEFELQPADESHPNENNLIYATLDLKPPTNRTPIKPDEVIYSEVQNVSRPNESVSVVPRAHKKH